MNKEEILLTARTNALARHEAGVEHVHAREVPRFHGLHDPHEQAQQQPQGVRVVVQVTSTQPALVYNGPLLELSTPL